MTVIHINDLPRETFAEILINTDGYTLGKCRRVCSDWKEFIDETEYIWQKMCFKDFKCSSRIAKQKTGNNCKWSYIYRNLKQWCDVTDYEKTFKEFYKFNAYAKSHSLDIDYGVLPLRDANGIVLYDTETLKYIPITIPDKDCVKIANNNKVTAVLTLKCTLLVQRNLNSIDDSTDALFEADNFVLGEDFLYYYKDRDIFKCDINNSKLSSQLILNCDYDIKEIQYNYNVICIYTKCGKFIKIFRDDNVEIHPLRFPNEWLHQIKHISLFDDKNFVCYSRNLFKIETDQCSHLYSHFPYITALFFYGEVILIGTKTGEILLYKLSKNNKASQPIFHTLVKLPEDKFALKIDVCERKRGSLVIISTFLELYTLEINLYPNEEQKTKTFTTYSKGKLDMYKRLLKLKERLKNS